MSIRHPYAGPNLRHYREQRKWSLRELEKHSGVPASNISRYERGLSEPSYEVACKLAKAIGIPVQLIWDHIPASIVAEGERS